MELRGRWVEGWNEALICSLCRLVVGVGSKWAGCSDVGGLVDDSGCKPAAPGGRWAWSSVRFAEENKVRTF